MWPRQGRPGPLLALASTDLLGPASPERAFGRAFVELDSGVSSDDATSAVRPPGLASTPATRRPPRAWAAKQPMQQERLVGQRARQPLGLALLMPKRAVWPLATGDLAISLLAQASVPATMPLLACLAAGGLAGEFLWLLRLAARAMSMEPSCNSICIAVMTMRCALGRRNFAGPNVIYTAVMDIYGYRLSLRRFLWTTKPRGNLGDPANRGIAATP
jgi:hypothetical protein